MHPLNHPRGRLWPFAAILWGMACGIQAEPTLLTVAQGSAWVREFFPPSGAKELERLVWTNPPAQIDLATLQIWNVRRPWPIREWHWLDAPAASMPTDNRQPLQWQPRAIPPPPSAHKELEIQLAERLSHAMGHSLTYRLPDFNWNAFYRVTVRGIGPESIDAVQVDLNGFLRIHNGTSAAFPKARISLVGTDQALQPPPKPFGLLDLNPDTALTDLWLAPYRSAPLPPVAYPLATEMALPPNGEAEFQFARVVRKPAQITHVCDSDAIPAPTPPGGLPLRRMLLIPNTTQMGLGFPLPPGQADLFLGAARGAPNQSGRVYHTPFPGMFQLDMGVVNTVLASRLVGTEEALPEGAKQVDYTLTLVNRLASPVRIQAVEKPTTPMRWSLVRSSVPCTKTTQELAFDLTLPPQSSKTITYRLRLVARSQS